MGRGLHPVLLDPEGYSPSPGPLALRWKMSNPCPRLKTDHHFNAHGAVLF